MKWVLIWMVATFNPYGGTSIEIKEIEFTTEAKCNVANNYLNGNKYEDINVTVYGKDGNIIVRGACIER